MTRETNSLLIVGQKKLNWSRDQIERNKKIQDTVKQKGEDLEISYNK